MKATGRPDHRALADALRDRVLEGPGETSPALRRAVALSAEGGSAAPPPYDALARQTGEAAYRTTDADVANVVRMTGSERATFEVIMAAAVGAGLLRWQQAMTVLDEATDATT
jgi:hypothetical protein